MTYLTREGDTADRIAWAELGSEAAVAALLEANPHLAELPPVLPYGIEVELPPTTPAVIDAPIRLWGG